MTPEEIKQRYEAGCKVSRETDELSLMYQDMHWLIVEVNRLEDQINGSTTFKIAVNKTATRCAEIADNMDEYAYADEVGEAIREEFNL